MIVHVLLFALFPVVFIYARNIDEVIFSDTYISTLAVLAIAIVALFVSRLIFKKDLTKAAITTSFFLMYFFSYGYLYEMGNFWTHHRYLIVAWTLIFLIVVFLIKRTSRDMANLNGAMNLVSVVLILISLLSITNYKITEARNSGESLSPALKEMSEAKLEHEGELPDIYYIVVDAYESSWGLEKFYNYDNSEFIDYLREKDFYVVDNSLSNYNSTSHVLATLLNMNYLEDIVLSGVVKEGTVNSRRLIQESIVPKMLKKLGYTHIHAGAFWGFSYNNKSADININKGYFSEFSSILYDRTILMPFGQKFGWLDMRREQYNRILYQFDELGKIANIDEPTFTFAHLGTPHSPYVFNRDGSFVSEEKSWDEKIYMHAPSDYLNQLIFINKKLEELVGEILERSPVPPIIVIQSDHGSRILTKEKLGSIDDITDDFARGRIRNFSAFYLPIIKEREIYDEMTQANSFRVIFNQNFGTEFDYLPDKSYLIPPWDGYDLIDVSDVVMYD